MFFDCGNDTSANEGSKIIVHYDYWSTKNFKELNLKALELKDITGFCLFNTSIKIPLK